MTKVILLHELKAFTEDAVKELLLPVKQQESDEEPPEPRPARVFLMRVPEERAATKHAPYILHQVITGADGFQKEQPGSGRTAGWEYCARTVIRSVFCVYHEDESEGGMELLNLMEQFRIALLEAGVVGKQFVLDEKDQVESLVYPDNGERGTTPYYLGEMITTWNMPIIKRKQVEHVITGGIGPYQTPAHVEQLLKGLTE